MTAAVCLLMTERWSSVHVGHLVELEEGADDPEQLGMLF